MQCRVHAAQLGQLYDQFLASETEVIVILGDTMDRAQSYTSLLKLPYPVLSDSQRSVYQTYGLDKVLLIQRTAALIVDKEGVIRYIKKVTNPMAWLQEAKILLEEARKVQAATI
jgi:peroxiredoxin